MSNKKDELEPAMTYKEIAMTLTKEEGIKYTEEQVKKICQRAINKLRAYTTSANPPHYFL